MKVKHGDCIDEFFEGLSFVTQKPNVNVANEKCEFEYVVKLKDGMHARPAGRLVNIVKSNDCKVNIIYNDKAASGDSIISIMALGITNGAKVKVVIEHSSDSTGSIKSKIEKIKKEIEKCLSEEG